MILSPILLFRRKDTPHAFARHETDDFDVRHGIATLWRKD